MSRHIPKYISAIMVMMFLAINVSARIISVGDDPRIGNFDPIDSDGTLIGDGTVLDAIYDSIQDAVNAANDGDIIQIEPGTYTDTIRIDKNIHLVGDGDTTYIEFFGQGPAVLIEDVDDVSISGLNIWYDGSAFDGQSGAAILVRNATVSISHCIIGGTGQGIVCADGAVVEIVGNKIIDNAQHGITGYPNSKIIQLSDNEIMGNGIDGIFLNGTTVETLMHNIIEYNGKSGIVARANTYISQLSENNIDNNTERGIYIEGSIVETLTDNSISYNSGHGISVVSGARITELSGNDILGSDGYGIHLMGATVEYLKYNIVEYNADVGIVALSKTQISYLWENEVFGNTGGIKLSAAVIQELSSNSIWENGYGIMAADGTSINQFSENEIFDNGGGGLNLSGAQVQILHDNAIGRNVYGILADDGTIINKLSANDLYSNGGAGIELNAATVEILISNTVWYNRDDGIAASSGSKIGQLSWNLICCNGQEGIKLADTVVDEMRNNTIVDNEGAGIKTDGNIQAVIRNNIIIVNTWGIVFSQETSAGAPLDLGYNDVWQNAQGDYGNNVRPGITDIHVNPMFVDAEGGDFHLQANSGLIGAGENGADIGAMPVIIREVNVSGSPATEGQAVIIRAVAVPGAKVSFDIEGIVYEVQMREIEPGVYEGEYTVLSSDRGIRLPVIVYIETGDRYFQDDYSQTVTLSGGLRSVQIIGSPAKAGDVIEVTLMADSGGYAEFSIQRVVHAVPMTEVQDETYTGSYYVEHGDNANDAVVEVLWIDRSGMAAFDDSQTVSIDTITVFAAGSPAKVGDVITITAAGKSGNKLSFSIADVDAVDIPMMESLDQLGIYRGKFLVTPGTDVHGGSVEVAVKMASGDSFVNSTTAVTIDTVSPDILSMETDETIVQNGDIFGVNVMSEPGAFVTMDVSALDTTQSLMVLFETDTPGEYWREVVVAPENQALNGQKTIYISAIDPAGNEAESNFQIELSNSKDPTSETRPDVFIHINPDVLPADGQSTALVTASLGEKISSLSQIRLDIRHSMVDESWDDEEAADQNAGHLSDVQLVQQDYVTATYTSGLSIGAVVLTLTILKSGEVMETHVILEPPGYGNASQILWDYLPQHQKIYQPARISGQLIPQVGGEIVFLTIVSPDALSNEIISLWTDSIGQFEHILDPAKEGAWSFQVTWPGNAFYQGSQSEIRQIIVVESIAAGELTESGWSLLTTADGLFSDNVTALAQNHEDQILIGTDWGLSIFDGEISRTFTTDDGLLGNHISAIEVDREGKIWIGSVPDEFSPGGLTMYDGFRWFEQITAEEMGLSYILVIHEDRSGGMWLGGDGLGYFNGTDLERIYLPVETEYDVLAFAEDIRGRFWVGTDAGLFLWQSGRWTHFTKEKNKLPSDHIQALLVDSEGILWIGAFPELDAETQYEIGGGLARYDGGTFEIFNVDNSKLPSDYVTSLMEDSDGQILIGMLYGGVVRYDEWQPLSSSLANQSVNVLLQDTSRQLWIGTEMGLHRFDNQTFNSWDIVQGKGVFLQDRMGIIWAGSEKGLTRFDGMTWLPVQEFWNVPVYSIAQHSDGEIWVGTGDGLSIFDGMAWRSLTEINGAAIGSVTALLPDPQGRMLLGTSSGLVMLLDGERWQDLTDKLGPDPMPITDFAVDSAGIFWVGTEYGLFHYDESGAASIEPDLKIETRDLAVDTKGNLWAATPEGLFRFNGGEWRIYSIRNSEIASDSVSALAVDALDRIWIGTDRGLNRFDQSGIFLSQEDAWATYTTDNSELADNDVHGLFVDSVRQLWISTPNAVVRFTPSLRPPDTEITKAPRSTVGTDSPSFEFTGSDIESGTSELLYSYKVDSGHWSLYSKSAYAILRHQSNGVHTFHVRAMDKDGNMDPTPAQRSFMIDTTPPTAVILYPAARQVVGGQIPIQGHAVDETDFESYTVLIKTEGQEVFRYTSQEPVDNGILAFWDTTKVADGIYNIILVVKDAIDGPDDETHTSTAMAPITVDNIQPAVKIISPKDDQSLSGVISMRGQASDTNMKNYKLMWTQDTDISQDTAWQLIASEEVQTPNVPIEQTWDSSSVYGITTIRLVAGDSAGNENFSDVTIQLENISAKPSVSITSPVANSVIAGIRRISGTANDSVFAGYRLDFRPAEEATEWTEIITQTTAVTNGKLGAWDTTAVSDGKYILRLAAMDNNGYTSAVTIPVIVDNSRPVAVIYPPAELVRGIWIAGGDVPIQGTATDVNFDSYLVEFGQGNDPAEWTSIEGASQEQVQDGVLRTWSTAGLNGEYTLRLTVTNKAELSSTYKQHITLDNQQAVASIISPEEGQFIAGEVAILGTADDENFKSYNVLIGQGQEPSEWNSLAASSSPREEDMLFNWDTTGLEGDYSIKLMVEDFTNDPVEEIRRVTVDNTAPQAEITAPQNNQIVNGDLSIIGNAQDENFLNYLVEYASGRTPSNGSWQAIGGLAVETVANDLLRSWNTSTVEDGTYSLRLTVTDNAGHVETDQLVVTIDNSPPEAAITAPVEDQFVIGNVAIIGTANDDNLKQYQIMIRQVQEPADWEKIVESFSPREDELLFNWDTTGIKGDYLIKLVVEDFTSGPVEEIRRVTIDNTPPQAEITTPRNDEMVSGDLSIIGTTQDENFLNYLVEYASGRDPSSDSWQTIGGLAVETVANDLLRSWNTATVEDGAYSLRLTVTDNAGHVETEQLVVTIDNSPPEATITAPDEDQFVIGNVAITGTASDENLKQYQIMVGQGRKPTAWETVVESFSPREDELLFNWDTTGIKGDYSIKLIVEDFTSDPVEDIRRVTVDNTSPQAEITAPQDTEMVRGDLSVIGTAQDENFDSYLVEYASGRDPSNDAWQAIGGLAVETVGNSVLRNWNTTTVDDGTYSLRLTVTDRAGHDGTDQLVITIDNNQPQAEITAPAAGQFVAENVAIMGTASDENLRQYQIMAGKGANPTTWDILTTSSISQQASLLYTWDTTGLEGEYSIKLVVEDFINGPVETIRRVMVDSVPPQAAITSPQNDQIVSGELNIRGTAQDENFQNYVLEYAPGSSPSSNAWRSIGGLAVQPVTGGILRSWNTTTVSDGLYSLRLTVTDSADHVGTAQTVLILDNQPPEAELNIPTVNGIVTGIVEIIGTASDLNLEEYELFIAPGVGSDDWQLISSGTESKTNTVLAEWDTAGLEGKYSIKLIAADLSEQDAAEDIQAVTIDNTDPIALITAPQDNHQVGGIIQLMGTAADANFKEYFVEFGKGADPQIWTKATAMEYRAPVESGELMQWFAEDRTGVFTIRLTVTDQVDHTSFAVVTVNIISTMARSEGGDRTSVDGLATLYLPPRALQNDTLVSVNTTSETEGAPSNNNVISAVYEIGPKDAKLTRSKPATLSISYASFSTPSPGKRLVIARFDENQWTPIGGVVNEAERTVTTAITEFGSYALMEIDSLEPRSGATITRLTCQPRIFSPNGSGFSAEATISFHLSQPATVSIMVYNRAGELVSILMEDNVLSAGVNAIQWNGRDEDGHLPSNMYIVAVRSGDQFSYKTVGIVNR